MSVGQERVGDILELKRRAVALDPATTYREIGLRSFGRGVFFKEGVSGASLGAKKVYEIHPDDLLLSNVFAWEGAVAVAGPETAGHIGSHRFMTWVPKEEGVVDVRYLAQYFVSDPGLKLIGRASPGSAGRNRTLGIKNFENIVIPLPDFPEQGQIADRLDQLASSLAVLNKRRTEPKTQRALLPRLLSEVLQSETGEWSRVTDVCTIVNDLVRPGEDPGNAVEFVGLEHIESHSGRRIGSRELGGEKGRKFRFAPGDVLYGYLRPYLNKVWVADRHGLCSVEQFVLRPNDGVDSTLLAHILRSGITLTRAIELTHSLQLPRLRSGLLMGLEIPDPRELGPEAQGRLDCVVSRQVKLAALTDRRNSLTKALLPAARNEEFARLM